MRKVAKKTMMSIELNALNVLLRPISIGIHDIMEIGEVVQVVELTGLNLKFRHVLNLKT